MTMNISRRNFLKMSSVAWGARSPDIGDIDGQSQPERPRTEERGIAEHAEWREI